MTENLVTDIKPISFLETYQETQDAFALLHLIRLSEKDIQNGDFEPAEKVFSELREEILKNGWKNLQC